MSTEIKNLKLHIETLETAFDDESGASDFPDAACYHLPDVLSAAKKYLAGLEAQAAPAGYYPDCMQRINTQVAELNLLFTQAEFFLENEEYSGVEEELKKWNKIAVELRTALIPTPEGREFTAQIRTLQSALDSATDTNRVLAERLHGIAEIIDTRQEVARIDSNQAEEDSPEYHQANARFMELCIVALAVNTTMEGSRTNG